MSALEAVLDLAVIMSKSTRRATIVGRQDGRWMLASVLEEEVWRAFAEPTLFVSGPSVIVPVYERGELERLLERDADSLAFWIRRGWLDASRRRFQLKRGGAGHGLH